MAEGKRYFWLKLYDDFFGSLRIKKLRKMAGGDTYVIIYLKMQLKAMKTDGFIQFRGVEADIVDELALDLDEEPDNVRVTLAYLLSCGLAETSDNVNLFLPYSVSNTGSETASAQRVRDSRERKALQCNTNVTQVKQQCNTNVTQVKQLGNAEIEKEKETDIEIEKKVRRFTPPTLEEVKSYCSERGNQVDAERFVDYYTANGWKVGKNPMKDWKAAVRTWERDSSGKAKPKCHMPGITKPQGNDDLDRAMRLIGMKNG